jgi:hypothetical protein
MGEGAPVGCENHRSPLIPRDPLVSRQHLSSLLFRHHSQCIRSTATSNSNSNKAFSQLTSSGLQGTGKGGLDQLDMSNNELSTFGAKCVLSRPCNTWSSSTLLR